ncbi:glycosyltransferase family 2 protein [Sporichthya polymorpha]|uniref:glycosyltransferase family 2 protein n=1 Tax=Sporichthya polymorpha TaxID=35751 RepID=UPI00036310CD|nr:glycosyltransferase family 2 protein [Sporichthya polymorpha]
MINPPPPADARHDVTVVLVTHDGERWLPQVLPALRNQTRPGDRLIVADTGSTDSTSELLAQHVPASAVISLPRDTGYGAAVKAALAAADSQAAADGAPDAEVRRWIWLLHDDSEPEPDALEHLLAAVDADPGLGVAGTKVRGWYRRRMLLEVGVTIDGGGRREEHLERGEQDQGQHDNRRETLAVSSAGMLVRRDVWDDLGGFDEHLPLMRDDVDFCWRTWLAGYRVAVVPEAVVYHAEASAKARREVDIGSGRVHLLDRAGAMRVLLANLPTRRFLLAIPRLFLGGLLRAIGYLVAKIPQQAADEVLAIGSVLLQPRAILEMRRERRADHRVAPSSLRRLFPRFGHQFALARDALTSFIGGRRTEGVAIGRHRVVESGPGADDMENLDLGAGGVLLRRVLRSPGWLLVLGLLALTLLAGRELLAGGRIFGGALLPAPGGASDLWSAYTGSWHPDSVGSSEASPPYLAAVAFVATLLGGHADLAVTVLLVGSVPMAGAVAYLTAGALPTSRALRVWGAAAYATLPVLSGAIATGRLGTAVAVVLLPAFALAFVRAIGTPGRAGTVRATWVAALTLTVMTAFVPLAWVLALLAAGAVAGAARGLAADWDRALLTRLAIVVALPPVALLPWSAQLLRHPSRFLGEPGAPGPDLAGEVQDTWRLLLLDAGGPNPLPGWVGLGVLVAGLVGLAVSTRRIVATAGVAAACLGYLVALVVSRFEVRSPAGGTEISAWPGLALALAALGLLITAIVGAHGLAERLAAREFGLAQPLAGFVALIAVGAPAIGGLVWIARGADGPIDRGSPVLVPAFVAAEAETSDRPRTLALRVHRAEGSLSYAIVRDSGPRLGAADVSPPSAAERRVAQLVGDLVSGRGDEVVSRLGSFAIRYVLVKAPVPADLARRLDAIPGLEQVSTQGGDGLWRVQVPVARLMFYPADGGAAVPVPSTRVGADAELPPGGGVLALAEPASSHWKASVDGRSLESQTSGGWAQAFTVPAEGGRLVVEWNSPLRGIWLFSQATLFLVMVVLALPGGGRVREDEEDVPVPTARRHAAAERVGDAS